MYIAAFIYKPGERDDEFQRLTNLIDALAARLPGYVGAESWRSADGGLINATTRPTWKPSAYTAAGTAVITW
eukprot:gene14387-22066_t